MFINRREKVGIEILKNPNALIDYSQKVDDAYEILEDYNPAKNRSLLILFDDMIDDIEFNKKLSPNVIKCF